MAIHIQLKAFDGPLDLLLHLIGKAKIAIEDLFISEITAQYIKTVQEATDFNADEASEFITMAALLIEIKSRHLLPKPKVEDEEDPEEMLLARLTAYQQLKTATVSMLEFEQVASLLFTKLPEEVPLPPIKYELEGLTLDALMNALLRIQNRLPKSENEVQFHFRNIKRDLFTLEECSETIERALHLGATPFSALFSQSPSREEVVTLFIALLEMLKLGKAHVVQSANFTDLMILPGRKENEDEN